MNKVTVSLSGGLGNQLFQYAAARALAVHLNSELVLDLVWFTQASNLQNTTIRKFALEPFNINARLQSIRPLSFTYIEKMRRTLKKIFHYVGMSTYNERQQFHFDSKLFSLNTPVNLNGYWQSYKYLEPIASLLFDEIGTVGYLNEPAHCLYEQIKMSEGAICVHIRRGDYITTKTALCGLDYYNAGLKIVARGLDCPHCYIFSDDPIWVRANFTTDFPITVVDINGPDDAHQDLWLMAACKNFVIANSSFSWWAAWLGNRPDKVVVVPAWWPSPQKNDFFPEHWIRVL